MILDANEEISNIRENQDKEKALNKLKKMFSNWRNEEIDEIF